MPSGALRVCVAVPDTWKGPACAGPAMGYSGAVGLALNDLDDRRRDDDDEQDRQEKHDHRHG